MKKAIFAGFAGKWLAYECLPPYIISFLIWPAFLFFTPQTSFVKSFFITFTGGDFFAIALCFLIPLFLDSNNQNDHTLGFETITTILMCTLLYWGVKISPPSIPETVDNLSFLENASLKVYIITIAAWTCAIRSTTLIYRHKSINENE